MLNNLPDEFLEMLHNLPYEFMEENPEIKRIIEERPDVEFFVFRAYAVDSEIIQEIWINEDRIAGPDTLRRNYIVAHGYPRNRAAFSHWGVNCTRSPVEYSRNGISEADFTGKTILEAFREAEINLAYQKLDKLTTS